MKETEIRSYDGAELRYQPDNRIVEGTAIVFNKRSNLLKLPNGEQFYEVILPEAINEEVLQRSDIHCLYNHDKNYRLARNKYNRPNQTLTMEITETGVNYSFRAKDDTLSEEFLEDLRDGDVCGSSFAFRTADGGDKWEKLSPGIYLRTITSFDRLYDCSPCSLKTAYDTGAVSCRSFDAFKEAEERALEEAKIEEEKRAAEAAAAEEKRAALAEYFTNLRNSIN